MRQRAAGGCGVVQQALDEPAATARTAAEHLEIVSRLHVALVAVELVGDGRGARVAS
jgi:hypothetical protein